MLGACNVIQGLPCLRFLLSRCDVLHVSCLPLTKHELLIILSRMSVIVETASSCEAERVFCGMLDLAISKVTGPGVVVSRFSAVVVQFLRMSFITVARSHEFNVGHRER